MSDIYVTGHRNPDTDSIVAAIAYANLRSALGDRNYKAARIGAINDETQHMLDRFGFEAPMYVKNMRTQVRDVEFDRPPVLDRTVTLDRAWRTMREQDITVIPITNADGTVYGMLSAGDIAAYGMDTIYESRLDSIPLFNLVSVLEGQLVNEYANLVNSISGDVRICLPYSYEITRYDRDTILLCGNQPEIIQSALEQNVNCIILCQTEIRREWAETAAETCILSTPLDARRAARILYQAIPVSRVCETEKIIAFHLSDYLDDIRESMLSSRYRSYPVLDENEHVVGTISRFHLLRPKRKQVVLVDHNEIAQSVSGLDQVEILEIIDHHRLADIQTRQPIRVRNEPVGSTNTILTAMYQENGVLPSPKLAGLMAAAILSDTVLFKSPTCTKRDIAMAERLARIANLSLEELGRELFSSAASEGRTAEELFRTDFKQFHIAEQNLGVSQITCADSKKLVERKEEFLQVMRSLKERLELDMILLMITDVLLEGSTVFYLGSDDVIRQAFNKEPSGNALFMPHVMSRKKQIVPMLTALWG